VLLYTIGHSVHSAEVFLSLLREHGIAVLVDVRRYPGSRRHPHFGREALEVVLHAAGVAYVHEPDLGGRRSPRRNSPNTALRSFGFRGYADHTLTLPFHAALQRLVATARTTPTAIMCAEAVPWRCHRQLIGDQLVFRGHDVRHILRPGRLERHRLHPLARRGRGGALVYPKPLAEQTRLFET
jgi:uncharacterized protein (DUF488 family)